MSNVGAQWLVFFALLSGCQTVEWVESPNARPVPVSQERNGFAQLIKSDIDRFADLEYRENSESLRTLMLKLYKRNPHEAAKSGLGSPEQIANRVFDQVSEHQWQFSSLNNRQGTPAILLAFEPAYTGDRVLALMVGLQSMLYVAHGRKARFLITDSLEPQNLYNAARNVEIALWKLSTANCAQAQPCLVSHGGPTEIQNLSFEREFGKIIARTDLLALTLAEKSQRLISRVTQVVSTRPFLPF